MCHSQSVRVPCCAQATPHLASRSSHPIADAAPLPFTIRPTPTPSTLIITQLPLSATHYKTPLFLATQLCLFLITTTYTQLLPLCNSLASLVHRPPTASALVLSVADDLSSLITPDHDTYPQQLPHHRDHYRHSHSDRRHAFQQHLQRLLHLFPRSFCRA